MKSSVNSKHENGEKGMLKVILRIFFVIFLLAAIYCVAFVASVMFIPGITARIRVFFFMIAGAVAFSVTSVVMFFLCGDQSVRERKFIRGAVIFYFAVYIVLFIGFVFFVRAYTNRESYTFAYNPHWLAESTGVLVPFRIIISQVKRLFSGPTAAVITAFDLVGNLVAYMPLAFFLPVMSKDYSRLDSFLPVVILSSTAVELFQGMFSLGTCCTDDMILGVLGALALFGIMKIGKVESLLRNHGIYFY